MGMAVYQFYFFKEPKQLKPPLRMQLKLMYIYTAGSGAARQQSEMWPKSGCGKQLQIMPEMENCCLDSTYSCLYYPQCNHDIMLSYAHDGSTIDRSKGFTSEKSVKTHHPSRVPDFAHGVLVRVTYIRKVCSHSLPQASSSS